MENHPWRLVDDQCGIQPTKMIFFVFGLSKGPSGIGLPNVPWKNTLDIVNIFFHNPAFMSTSSYLLSD
jgi:hypothetical protein